MAPETAPTNGAAGARATQLALALLTVGALWTRVWALRVHDEVNADEALPGLMALHIAAGRETPIFYYGQHYFGAAEAYLVAAMDRSFGFHPWLMYLPAIAASTLLVPVTYALGAAVGGRLGGLFAALPVAVPPPLLARLYANAGGGFSLAFMLHGLLLVCTVGALRSQRHTAGWAALGSLVAGPLIWIWQPAAALYAALIALLVFRRPILRRPVALVAALAPVVPGLLPPLVYNAHLGWPSALELAHKYAAPANEASSGPHGDALAALQLFWIALGGGNEAEGGANAAVAGALLGGALLAGTLLLSRATGRGLSGLVFSRPGERRAVNDPASVEHSTLKGAAAGPTTEKALQRPFGRLRAGSSLTTSRVLERPAFAGTSTTLPLKGGRGLVRRARRQAAIVLALAVLVDFLAAHNTARHLVPAALAAAALAGGGLGLLAARRPAGTITSLSVALFAALLPNALLWRGADQAFKHFVPRESESRAAVQALDARGLTAGYSDYWSAYPITYLAAERIVVAPAVPAAFGGRFDRYPAYTRAVDAIEDAQALFLLLDDRCSPLPYAVVLEQQGAAYQLEHLARWYLLWDIRPEPGAGGETLAAWRHVIYTRQYC